MFSLKNALTTLGVISMTSSSAISSNNVDPHWDAKLYQKNSVSLQQMTSFELIDTLSIAPNDHILDVGCGDGKITQKLAELSPQGFVEAFDLSEAMIQLAKGEYNSIQNMSFSVGDAETVSYGKQFDWVMSFFCLQWVKDKQKALNTIAAHLKPGGRVALIMTNRNLYLLQVRKTLMKDSQFSEYFKNYADATDFIDNDDYKTFASNAGLKDIVYKENERPTFFKDKEGLKTFIKMVTSVLNALPSEDLKEQFLNQLIDGYLKIVPPVQGTKNQITYTIKTLTAQK